MDQSSRQITKIAREVSKFTVKAMKAEGIGTAEFDFIHQVRHHPGITQTQVRDALKIDKGAAARRAAAAMRAADLREDIQNRLDELQRRFDERAARLSRTRKSLLRGNPTARSAQYDVVLQKLKKHLDSLEKH